MIVSGPTSRHDRRRQACGGQLSISLGKKCSVRAKYVGTCLPIRVVWFAYILRIEHMQPRSSLSSTAAEQQSKQQTIRYIDGLPHSGSCGGGIYRRSTSTRTIRNFGEEGGGEYTLMYLYTFHSYPYRPSPASARQKTYVTPQLRVCK